MVIRENIVVTKTACVASLAFDWYISARTGITAADGIAIANITMENTNDWKGNHTNNPNNMPGYMINFRRRVIKRCLFARTSLALLSASWIPMINMERGIVIAPTVSRKFSRRGGSCIPKIKINKPMTLDTTGMEKIDLSAVFKSDFPPLIQSASI